MISRLVSVLLLLVTLTSCTRPPWPAESDASQFVLRRLQHRHEAITSATYRVRWVVKGTEPHGEFLLDIAYKAPDKFRVSATGPFGVSAFTAVVVGEMFWFVDHHHGEFVTDSLQNLEDYNVPLSSFFSGMWRDLFSGGWGGTETVTGLAPTSKRDHYEARVGGTEWRLNWDSGKQSPRYVKATEGTVLAETWFGSPSTTLPYWEMQRLELRGFPGGGRHSWKILKQTYDSEILDRFFDPLHPPSP